MTVTNDQPGGFKGRVMMLDKKYGIFRAIKFGIAGIVGFIIAEVILALGVLVLYDKISVPSGDYSSIPLILLNVVAFGTAVTAGFFVNESITVRDEREPGGRKRILVRLLKFQLAYLAGNIVTIVVQLALLGALAVTPILGNIVGAIVAFPFSYLISMRFVWNIKVSASVSVSGETQE
ncbi:MAG: GtrA family protein [Nitrososphaerales archaeon]